MKFITKLILSIILTFNIANAQTFNGYANLNNQTLGDVEVNGHLDVKDSAFKSLDVNGSTTFSNLAVTGSMNVSGAVKGSGLIGSVIQIDGALEVDQLKADQLVISGSFNANHVDVSGQIKVSGGFSSNNSSFHDIEISSDKVSLNNTKANNITFDNNRDDVQQLILTGKTVITGDVVFKSGNGKVVLNNGAVIKGKVIGGKTVTSK